jgi:hypothetical protein
LGHSVPLRTSIYCLSGKWLMPLREPRTISHQDIHPSRPSQLSRCSIPRPFKTSKDLYHSVQLRSAQIVDLALLRLAPQFGGRLPVSRRNAGLLRFGEPGETDLFGFCHESEMRGWICVQSTSHHAVGGRPQRLHL